MASTFTERVRYDDDDIDVFARSDRERAWAAFASTLAMGIRDVAPAHLSTDCYLWEEMTWSRSELEKSIIVSTVFPDGDLLPESYSVRTFMGCVVLEWSVTWGPDVIRERADIAANRSAIDAARSKQMEALMKQLDEADAQIKLMRSKAYASSKTD